jgi:hypothetical protein
VLPTDSPFTILDGQSAIHGAVVVAANDLQAVSRLQRNRAADSTFQRWAVFRAIIEAEQDSPQKLQQCAFPAPSRAMEDLDTITKPVNTPVVFSAESVEVTTSEEQGSYSSF